MSAPYGQFVVVDPRLAAPRGEEYTASAENDRGYVQRTGDTDALLEETNETDAPVASLHEAIPEDNVGFKLLQKMGWKGSGLGRNEDGMVEPIKPATEPGVKLGVGKAAEDDFFTAADNIHRKKLETELQATETEERARRREMQAEREQRIREDVSTIKRTFYCEVCHKQYNTAMELDTHLSSYDHHHKKRLQEMKAMTSSRDKQDRQKRQQKQAAKEMARLQAQVAHAQAQRQGGGAPSAQAPPPPPAPPNVHEATPPPPPSAPPPPPPPVSAPAPPPLPPPPSQPHRPSTISATPPTALQDSGPSGLSFAIGGGRGGFARGRGAAAAPVRQVGIKRPAAPPMQGPAARRAPVLAARPALFGQSDSDEDS